MASTYYRTPVLLTARLEVRKGIRAVVAEDAGEVGVVDTIRDGTVDAAVTIFSNEKSPGDG